MSRHGAIAGPLVALAGLVLLAGITAIAGASFVIGADRCAPGDARFLCSSAGQVLSTWVPLGGAGLGVLSGVAGMIAGRPVRAPALIAGYALTLAGLIGGWAITS